MMYIRTPARNRRGGRRHTFPPQHICRSYSWCKCVSACTGCPRNPTQVEIYPAVSCGVKAFFFRRRERTLWVLLSGGGRTPIIVYVVKGTVRLMMHLAGKMRFLLTQVCQKENRGGTHPTVVPPQAVLRNGVLCGWLIFSDPPKTTLPIQLVHCVPHGIGERMPSALFRGMFYLYLSELIYNAALAEQRARKLGGLPLGDSQANVLLGM